MTTVRSAADSWQRTELAELAERSLAIILEHQHASGAYPASPDFSAYRGYSWFRDGAFIADGVSAFGAAEAVESATRFHDWCVRILTDRSGRVEEIAHGAAAGSPVPGEAMLPTRFTLEGAEGDDEWWDFQLDGYGTWLWAVADHVQRHELDPQRWLPGIRLAVDYLVSSWQRPCFDWWEEHASQVHVSTLGCIAAGLRSVQPFLDEGQAAAATAAVDAILALIAEQGIVDGHLVKWLGSTEVDASLLSLISPLRLLPADSETARATIMTVDAELAVDRGVHRYAADTFYGGGQWPLLSCMLGLAAVARGDAERGLAQLRWAAATARPDGTMPEQVPDHLLAPHMRQEWLDRWGPVATPLLWSHGMFLRLAVELGIGEQP